jgi:glyoxylase-like metal-dependent hydrolase (beta-lactamase superfamily II)
MKKHAFAALALALAANPVVAQNVKITPIGSHPGELCANDRAIIFEDPTGVRLLYDPAHNVTGGDDPRLGTIHAVLLSHMHRDHVGDLKLKAPGAGTCANSGREPAPNSTTAEVVAANGAIPEYGPATGFIVKFTNGLTAYLTGDTGVHTEMKTVVHDYHKANLAVMNLGVNAGAYF